MSAESTERVLIWTATGLMVAEFAILIYLSYRNAKGTM
jgi:biopolymer transport protein ExbB/TolQ